MPSPRASPGGDIDPVVSVAVYGAIFVISASAKPARHG